MNRCTASARIYNDRRCRWCTQAIVVACAWLFHPVALVAQESGQVGRAIGKVSTRQKLVVVELNRGAIEPANLFDLVGRTLVFRPSGARYRSETKALEWDDSYGTPLTGAEVALTRFAFPFSGARWKSFLVGNSGSIRFGASERDVGLDDYGKRDGGVTLGRFDALGDAASALVDSVQAICVFLKPRLSGARYVKELPDRVVITWELTEPFGGILDFGWFATVNRFQAVLHDDGTIDMSYKQLSARDAIVGVYPRLSGETTRLATIEAPADSSIPAHLDVRTVDISLVDRVLLRVTLKTRGAPLHAGTPALEGVSYRIDFGTSARADSGRTTTGWIVRGARDPYNPKGGPVDYSTDGEGLSPRVLANGDSIVMQGILPGTLQRAKGIVVSGVVSVRGGAHIVERIPPRVVDLSTVQNPEVHFASLDPKADPYSTIYEAFHYSAAPRPQDLACTVIRALGDNFDFLVYYSDFRIDAQEATSPSFGPAAGNVTGIGQTSHESRTYCSGGRFQWALNQPVFVGATEMYAQPPGGAPVGNNRDITFYLHRLSEESPDKKPRSYNYAMSHLGHEMAHRWGAYVAAKVAGDTISLGPWPHWGREVQTAVAFPYQLRTEASTLGGGVWRDNGDGTFTQLRDGYFVPATGYSPLDLYLMGFLRADEVPDFFVLRNLVPAGRDSAGHAVFRAERQRIAIADVIALEGPRSPDPSHSQRRFNTGIVLVVEHGHAPTATLIERARGIRQQWIDYWATATGGRSKMRVEPR